MDARFKVAGGFSLSGGVHALHGVVETGVVREGMRARNLSGVDGKVIGLEFLRRPDGRDAVALFFDCPDPMQRGKWDAAAKPGTILDLVDE